MNNNLVPRGLKYNHLGITSMHSGGNCTILLCLLFVCLFVCFSHPIYYLRLSFSLPPFNRRNSDPGSPSRLFSSSPTTVRAFKFYRAKKGFSPFFPRRLASNCACPRYSTHLEPRTRFWGQIISEFQVICPPIR